MNILLVPSGIIRPINSLEQTPTLQRLQAALAVWQTGKYDYLILSGSKVWPDQVSTKPDAEIMYDWLISQPNHPPLKKIYIENKARDTYENCSLTLDILKSLPNFTNDCTLTLVTNPLHAKRFLVSLQQGYQFYKVAFVDTQEHLSFSGILREYCLIFIHSFDPTGKGFLPTLNRKRRTRPPNSPF